MISSTPRSYAKKSDANAAKSKPWVISVHALPGNGSTGILRFGALTMPCALGRSGIVALKREGDGGTPRALMSVTAGYFRRRGAPMPQTRLPTASITPDLGWCDAPRNPNYNRPVRLPFKASHERMWRSDGLYDFCLVLDWNYRSRTRFAGSAIFLHLARPGYQPTEGCIAIHPRDMARLLPYISASIRLAIGRAIKRQSSR
jgi:L,D-peptidoglycan transpeptidase YkuD (ErfK/YbiS/YcfS/YnhG family)